ncbi:MAG: GNAT family N-acetyltransferase [Pseudonocardiaceae bacterium]
MIRRADAADLDALAQLRWEFRTAGAAPTESRDAFLARFQNRLGPALAEGRWQVWVAVADPPGVDVVGHVYAARIDKLPNPVDEPESHLYISNLYVRPDHRGHGLGGQLLTAALESATSVDAAILWGRPRAARLYRRHGFVPSSEILERR